MLRVLLIILPIVTWVGSVRAEILSIPVPGRTIGAGAHLVPDMFVWKQFQVGEVARRNYATSLDQLVGRESGRSLAAGRPVALKSVQSSKAVRKGDIVSSYFTADTIRIEAVLQALQDGVAGEVIKAKNPASGLVVDARVSEDGTLVVGGP
jgi:flagellar basal body P-ring formation protein FlgA